MTSSKLLVTALAFTTSIASAQSWPKPTAPMQAGIDKDTSRHFGDAPPEPGPLATDLSPKLTPGAIDAATRKVADWQLRVSEPYFERIWTWSVLYSGFIAVSESTGDPKYRDAMQRMSEHFNYELAGHTPNADTQSIAQTYLELYLAQAAHDKAWSPDLAAKMIAPTRADLDFVSGLSTLKPGHPRIPWWWCDALFMAPPVWARMYAVTGDRKYIDYLDKQWAATYAVLWDADEHLYARDETFKTLRGPNGKKIFWSRGEGWVMGGLARTLEYMPKDDPRRAFYEQNLRELAASLTKLLDPKTHLFHASLLDAEHFPLDETSGSALYLYGLTWGVNEGVLDTETYKPVIEQVWASLLKNHVYADGRFGGIQQTGAEPAFYPPSASFTYGVGGYLLAAAELKRMSLGHHAPARLAQQLPPQSKQLPSTQTAIITDPSTRARIDLPTPADPNLQNLILVGDSTVRNGKGDGANNQMGWGDELAPYFDLSKINVVNRAIGGRSSRTYITEGHWTSTLPFIRTGDVVLIQFGHNDDGPLDDTARARGSIKGIGEETKEIENPITKRHETVHTFGYYLAEYVRDIKARGATPVLCSMIPRKIWVDGKVQRTTDSYRGWTRAVAEREHVAFVDLNEIIAEKYEALGQSAVEPLFGDEHTHTTAAGAILNAQAVVAGLKALSDDPVAKDFSPKGEAIPAFHP